MPQNGIPVVLARAISNGATPYHYNANTAGYQVKTGQGVVRSISINTAGATATLTLYDGTSTAGAVLGVWSVNTQYNATDLNIQFTTGLFMVAAGTTAPDATILYN